MRDTSSIRAVPDAVALSSQDLDLPHSLHHQHEALRRGVPHVWVGQFSVGDPGQFCTGGYSFAPVEPGDLVLAQNVAKVKDLVLPGVSYKIEHGMTLKVVAAQRIEWPPPYKAATEGARRMFASATIIAASWDMSRASLSAARSR